MAIAAPAPTDIGLLVAQQGADDVIESYRAGTLGSGMTRVVENMVKVCDATGAGAQQVADDTVRTCLERWSDATGHSDAHAAARNLMLASCTLAGFRLHSEAASTSTRRRRLSA
jgi:hypothetical protein